jgi:hypothetical protein
LFAKGDSIANSLRLYDILMQALLYTASHGIAPDMRPHQSGITTRSYNTLKLKRELYARTSTPFVFSAIIECYSIKHNSSALQKNRRPRNLRREEGRRNLRQQPLALGTQGASPSATPFSPSAESSKTRNAARFPQSK